MKELAPEPGRPVVLTERYPRADRPWLRVNFIASADGASAVDGLSAGLQGPGDKEIFDRLRATCDALVVAAGTVRAEGYDGLRPDAGARAERTAAGLDAYPLMVVVSGSLELDPDQPVFADAPRRPVVLTFGAARPSPRLSAVAEVITVGDLRAGLAALRARGAAQLLCEGGPRLFGSLLAGDLVDELCLTVSPLLVGGDAGRIAAGGGQVTRRMRLAHVLAEGDMLFLRYVRDQHLGPIVPRDH